MEKVRILEKRRVFDDIFKIEEAIVEVQRQDGSWSPRTRQLSFERGDSVAALLTNRDSGRIVLVRQFRYPTLKKGPGWLTEIVAGGLDEGETAEAAIAREVREETGYRVTNLRPLATFYVSPGGTSERVLLFYGEVAGPPEATSGAAHEDIEVIESDPEQLWEDLRAGRLQDAKTIMALLWHRLNR